MTKYDAMFMGVAQQEGSISGVLTAFFDFLHRNTDFYVVSSDPQRKMGFAPGQAENLLHQSFNKFPYKFIDDETKGTTQYPPSPLASNATVNAPAPAKAKPGQKATPVLTSEGKQVPVGNGGSAANYTWTQSLRDVTVHVDVPVGTKSKDVHVEFTHTSVTAGLKGQPPLLHGTFPCKIKLEDTVWSLDSNRSLVLSIEKVKETWWKCVVEGDPEIDTSQVDSTQRIDDYDPETQGAIRKIMFEQRQQTHSEIKPSMNFPTSLNME